MLIASATCAWAAAYAEDTVRDIGRMHGEASELAAGCPAATYDPEGQRLGAELAQHGVVLSDEAWDAIAAGVLAAEKEVAGLSENQICKLALERYGPNGTEKPGLIEFE